MTTIANPQEDPPSSGAKETYHFEPYDDAKARMAWKVSPERRQIFYFEMAIWIGAIAVGLLVALEADQYTHTSFLRGPPLDKAGSLAYILGAIIAFTAIGTTSRYRRQKRAVFDDRRLIAERETLAKSESTLAASGELDLAALWHVTQQRLDYYHKIVTEQARQSFRNAQGAMIAGLLILILSATAAVFSATTAGAIITGSLGAIGTALAGYIGRTFLKSQESAASHLRAYFDQPLQFSRYLAAERLILTASGDQKDAAAIRLAELILRDPHEAPDSRAPNH